MIVYEVPKKTEGTGSFRGLISYLSNTQGNEARVGEIFLTNFEAENLNVACIEALALQKQNSRAKSDKTLHLVMSFPEGERPSKEVLKQCEQILVDNLGLSDHQRISICHGDTDNLHLHIVINKINPNTKNIVEPFRSHVKISQTCSQCEEKFELIRDNHKFVRDGVETKKDKIEIHKGEETLLTSIRNIKDKLNNAKSWKEFQEILSEEKFGIKVRANGFVFFNENGIHVKASSVDRSFSMKKLEGRFGAFKPIDIETNAEQEDVQPEKTKENINNIHENNSKSLKDEDAKKSKKNYKKSANHSNYEAYRDLWNEYQDIRLNSKKYDLEVKKKVYKELYHTNKKNFKKILFQYKIFSMLKIPKFMRSYLNLYLSMKTKELANQAKQEAKRKLEKQLNSKKSWLVYLKNKAEAGNMDALSILIRRNKKTNFNKQGQGSSENTDTKNFSMLKSVIEHKLHAIKITSKGNKIYKFRNKIIILTSNNIFINDIKHRKNFYYKKNYTSDKYTKYKFYKKAKKHNFNYRKTDITKDFDKTKKVYEFVREQTNNNEIHARVSNGRKIQNSLRRNNLNININNEYRRGINL